MPPDASSTVGPWIASPVPSPAGTSQPHHPCPKGCRSSRREPGGPNTGSYNRPVSTFRAPEGLSQYLLQSVRRGKGLYRRRPERLCHE